MDSNHNSSSYTQRLEKYAKRGFAIGLPGFNRSLLSPKITSASYVFMKKHDLLLKILASADHPGCTRVQLQTGASTTTVVCRTRRAERVTGIKRLAAVAFCNNRVREIEAPHLARTNFKTIIAQNVDDGVVLLHGDQPGDYWLLQGVTATEGDEPSEASDEDDDLFASQS